MTSPIATVLITGGNGNLGKLVADQLLARRVKVVKYDLPLDTEPETRNGETIVGGDIRDTASVSAIVDQHQPDTIIHLASLLSGSSEADRQAAWEINASASFNLLELAVAKNIERFFFASTAATYSAVSEKPMPQDYPQWPENFYGATKVAVERLGVYYKLNHNLDFRCLRFPLVVSPFAPATAVSAYPSHAIKAANKGEHYRFPVSEQTAVSTIFLDDVVDSIVNHVFADRSTLKRHAYNLHAYELITGLLIDAISKHKPEFEYSFEPVGLVQTLISGWADVSEDSEAREDWGWSPRYDLDQSVTRMFELIDK